MSDSSSKTLEIRATIERKESSLPRFVVVPSSRLKSWHLEGTTPVEVVIDGTSVGRRNLKRWGKDRDCWFIDLTDAICKRTNVDTGSRISLDLRRASTDLPAELSDLLASRREARLAWEARTPGQRRMLVEYVLAAKQPATRARRAAKELLPH